MSDTDPTTDEPDTTTTSERERAADFWARYDLPFEHDVAIKGRLSGLQRGSAGTGRARDTVNHLFVQEAFEDGRLSRDAESYLCDPNARPEFEFTEERYSDDQGEYVPRVTCQTCLDRMARWGGDQQ